MTRRISLALQGGGAHGAFTWGVLDRLLEEDDLEIVAISGTSAGALNGAALKSGLGAGGPRGARAALDALWDQIGSVSDFRFMPWVQPWMPVLSYWQDVAEMVMPVSPQGLMAQLYSPYAWGANWTNPLEPIVRGFDFSHVCAGDRPWFFVGATAVRTGRIRIFEGQAITPEALMASACVPTVFQAVEVEGEPYWDGGFSGNPALFPLYRPDLPDDIVIVSINPFLRDDLPRTALDIQNRINEISFHAALLGELRAVHFVRRLIAEGRMEQGRMKAARMHLISDDALMTDLSASTKLTPSPSLLARLRAAGRAAADGFLRDHGGKIGHEPSLDLGALFG